MNRLMVGLLVLTPSHAHGRLLGFLPLDEAPATFLSNAGLAELGNSVAFVGDVNGDGFSDALFGAYVNGDAGFQAGKIYLLMGEAGGFDGTFFLEDSAYTRFIGEGSSHYAGSSLAAAGDLDGDGFGDFLIGARGAQIDAGWVYLFYGSDTFPQGTFDLGDADAVFKGKSSGDSAGIALGGVGDINGDGRPDIALGAPKEDQGARNSGAVHLFFGGEARFSGTYSVLLSDATIRGEAGGAEFGTSLAGGLDVDGDGFDDLVVGAPRADPLERPDGGAVYLFRGGPSFGIGEIPLATAEIVIAGETTTDYLGSSVDVVPDVDGDGRAEIIAGAVRQSASGSNAGASYLIYGREAGTWPLTILSAEAFDTFLGEAEQDSAGTAVAGLGDIDGDGLGEIVFTAPLFDNGLNNAGRVGLYYGALPWPGESVLSQAPAGFDGVFDSQLAGTALGQRGDMDGDGYPDLLIGSSALGQVHLILLGRYIDQDNDDQRVVDGDCDDHDPSIGTGFPEICQDEGEIPIDNDCDGTPDEGCLFPTPTPTPSPTPTPVEGTPTPTPVEGTPTPTPVEDTPTRTQGEGTPTAYTPTPTRTPQTTASPTAGTPTIEPSEGPTNTAGGTPTASTQGLTPTPTATPEDPSDGITPSANPTVSPNQGTPSGTSSPPSTTTASPTSDSPTSAPGPTPTSGNVTPSGSTMSPTAPLGGTPSPTPSPGQTSDESPTARTAAPSSTAQTTQTPQGTPSSSAPPTPTPTPGSSPTHGRTSTPADTTPTPTPERTPTPSPTRAGTPSLGQSPTPFVTDTPSPTRSPTPLLSPTSSATPSPSPFEASTSGPRPVEEATQEIIYAPVVPWEGDEDEGVVPPEVWEGSPEPTPSPSPLPTSSANNGEEDDPGTGPTGGGFSSFESGGSGCACIVDEDANPKASSLLFFLGWLLRRRRPQRPTPS